MSVLFRSFLCHQLDTIQDLHIVAKFGDDLCRAKAKRLYAIKLTDVQTMKITITCSMGVL